MSSKNGGFPDTKIGDALGHMSEVPNSNADDPVNAIMPLCRKAIIWCKDVPRQDLPNYLICVIDVNASKHAIDNSLKLEKFLFQSTAPSTANTIILAGASIKVQWIVDQFVTLEDADKILSAINLQNSLTLLMQLKEEKITIYSNGFNDPDDSRVILLDNLQFSSVSIDGAQVCLESLKRFHDRHTALGANDKQYWADKPKCITADLLEKKIQRDLNIHMLESVEKYGATVLQEGQNSAGRLDTFVNFSKHTEQDTVIELKAIRDRSEGRKSAYTSTEKSNHVLDGIEQTQAYITTGGLSHGILAVYDACEIEETTLKDEVDKICQQRGLKVGWYHMFNKIKVGRKAMNEALTTSKKD